MSSVKHGDHEYAMYRGFRLRVNHQSVEIFEGKRKLGEVVSMSGVRSFIKGYRRA